MDDPRHSTFSAASDAGSVTGSFTGSLDGQQSQSQSQSQAQGQGQQPKGGKKRGRKSKAEKEREREREDALSRSGLGGGGGGGSGGGFRGSEARVGSVDVDGGSSVRTGPAGGGGPSGGAGGGGGAGGNAEDAEDEEDFDDEGELLGREEGATDIEAEKKNLAYVSLLDMYIVLDWKLMLTDADYWWTHSTRNNRNDTICSNEPSYGKKPCVALSTTHSLNRCPPAW